MQYATLNSQAQTDKEYVGENQLSGPLAKYAFGPDNQKMYGPVKEGDTYTLARVVDTKMLPDSVGARHILLPAGQAELADSIVKALQGGASFAELAEVYSNDPGSKSKGGDLGVFAPSQMVPEFGDAVLANEKGKVFTVDSRFGTHIAEVTYLSKPTKKVQLATITYRIEPSQTTQQAVYANASKFIAEAHGSYENFDKAVASNSLSKRVARIRNTDRNLNGIDNSREIVRWAFNGEKGDVSAIMDIDGNYIVAAITGVTADGIAPVESVSKPDRRYPSPEEKGRNAVGRTERERLARRNRIETGDRGEGSLRHRVQLVLYRRSRGRTQADRSRDGCRRERPVETGRR